MKAFTISSKPISRGLIYLIVFLVAFIPRTLALDAYVAPDEGKWIYRSAHFLQALLEGDLAQTTSVAATPEVEVLAPAVPTMWTGAAGLIVKYWTDSASESRSLPDFLAAIPDQTEEIPLHFYPWTRFPTVFLTSLAILLFFVLLSKLVEADIALVAALLLALDPFFISLSRVIHHDALVSIFILLALLTLLLYRRHPRPRFWLILSGISGGLALSTKPTALYLVAFVGLFLLLENGVPHRRRDWQPALAAGVAWGAIALVTLVAVWPALWVAPIETVSALLDRSARALSDNNNYSLLPAPGSPLPELGFLYYPVNWLFKATLPLMVGLVALGIGWWRGWLGAAGGESANRRIGESANERTGELESQRGSESANRRVGESANRRIGELVTGLGGRGYASHRARRRVEGPVSRRRGRAMRGRGSEAVRPRGEALGESEVKGPQDRFDGDSEGLVWLVKWLAIFALLFLLLLIPADTRDIRYFLPAVPALYGLAAIGLLALIARLNHHSNRFPDPRTNAAHGSSVNYQGSRSSLSAARFSLPTLHSPRSTPHAPRSSWVIGLLLVLQILLTLAYFPYYVNYWNPVVGGPWLAPRLVKIGSGEGLDQMGRHLSQKPEAAELTVATSFWESFAPFFSGDYTKAHYDEEADYILIYRRQIQNRNPFPEYWTYFSARTPEHTVSLVGLDYAWLYPGPQLRVVRDADYGHGLALRGYRLEQPVVQPGQRADLTLVWAGARPELADQTVDIRLTDGEERLWARARGPLLAPDGPSPVEGHYTLEIPAQMKRGDYELWVAVNLSEDGTEAGPGLKVGRIAVRQLEKPPVQLPASVNFGDFITFGGAEVGLPSAAPEESGRTIDIKFLWQARRSMVRSYTTFAHVVDDTGTLWGQADRIPRVGDHEVPTNVWEKGEWIGDTFRLSLRPNLPAGTYTLLAGVYDSQTLERLPILGEPDGQTVVRITSIKIP